MEPKVSPDGDLIFQHDDLSKLFAPTPQDSMPWQILIVDDDVDVHVVTKFALSHTNFLGRRLAFLHAYSGAEAMALMRGLPDIALVLLDVIMETPDAGLRVARSIREKLHDDLVRIVLRTGQPGQALEHSIIVDYDIHDFWCKADLTTRKLFSTVISSLRAYATMTAAAGERDAMAGELVRARQLQMAADKVALMLTLDADGRIADANDNLCRLAGTSRAQLVGQSITVLQPSPFPAELAAEILAALAQTGGWTGEVRTALPSGASVLLRCAALSFKDGTGLPTQYAAVATRLD